MFTIGGSASQRCHTTCHTFPMPPRPPPAVATRCSSPDEEQPGGGWRDTLNLFAISRTDLLAKHHRALHIVADLKVFKNPPKQEAILGVEDFNFSPPPIAGCPKRCQNFIEYQLIVSKVPSPTRAICAPTPTLDTDGMQQKTRFRAAGPFDWAFGNT